MNTPKIFQTIRYGAIILASLLAIGYVTIIAHDQNLARQLYFPWAAGLLIILFFVYLTHPLPYDYEKDEDEDEDEGY
jgi:hypothetical protein